MDYLEDNTGLSLDFTSGHRTKFRTRPTKLDYSNNKSSYAVLPLTRVRSFLKYSEDPNWFFYNYEYPKKGHLLILLSRLARDS